MLHKAVFTEGKETRKDGKTIKGIVRLKWGRHICSACTNVCVHMTVCACVHVSVSRDSPPQPLAFYIASCCLISSRTWDHEENSVSETIVRAPLCLGEHDSRTHLHFGLISPLIEETHHTVHVLDCSRPASRHMIGIFQPDHNRCCRHHRCHSPSKK